MLVPVWLVAEMLPTVALPLTDKLVNTPTDVKLDVTTPEFNTVPVKLLAFTELAVTPVNADPLPIKYPAKTLPVPLTLPDPNRTLPPVMLPVTLVLEPVITPPTTLAAVVVPVTLVLEPVMTPPTTLAPVMAPVTDTTLPT